MQTVYVTEPKMISLDELRELLPTDKFEIEAGQTELHDGFSSDAEVMVIRSATHADGDYLQHFPQLTAVVRVGVGLDNVDTDYCRRQGIAVYNAPGANADAVAEYVTAMILYANRRLGRLTPERVGNWQRSDFMGTSISEQTVGIVGFGNIGKLLQQKLRGLGAQRFLVYDPYLPAEVITQTDAEAVELDDVLSQCNVVSMHLPLTPETKYLIDGEKLQLLPDNAILVNASRGGVVEEAAILDLAPERNITYIADTVENEPEVNPQLLENERVIVTPHIASLTTASDQAMLRVAVDNFLQGKAVKV